MYIKDDHSHFNDGYYILDKDISCEGDHGDIEIRAGSIVYAEKWGYVEHLVEVRPYRSGYFDYVRIPPQIALTILRKTPEIISLEDRLVPLQNSTDNAGFFKRHTKAYKNALEEIEQIKSQLFALENNENIYDNEATFARGRSIRINKQNPYSLTVTPPGVTLNLESVKGFAVGDKFHLFGQDWVILSMTKAFAKLPEGATSIDVLQALPPAAKECLDIENNYGGIR